MRAPITSLNTVGPKLAAKLASLNIHTVLDLLFHFPLRYEDRTTVTPIDQLIAGHKSMVEGRVLKAGVQYHKRRTLVCHIADDTGSMMLKFFHFNAHQVQQLSTPGTLVRGFGAVAVDYRSKAPLMIHPEYRCHTDTEMLAVSETFTPIYPLVTGLTQRMLRRLIADALDVFAQDPVGVLNIDALVPKALGWSFADALVYVHQPKKDQRMSLLLSREHPAQRRLAFEEMVAHQCAHTMYRYQYRQNKAESFSGVSLLQAQLIEQLPFALTDAQARVLAEIDVDLAQVTPMLRLVQGDVGSGKTIVAALSILRVAEQGRQAALMAPTELLAEQHFHSLSQWFEPFGITVVLLTGSQTKKMRAHLLQTIADNQAKVVVGTHALFQQTVIFSQLSLLVIDEQHRFGVDQRMALKNKGMTGGLVPHQLMMTATPIPRTLAMTAYANLDVSSIDQLPKGRVPIVTSLVSLSKRNAVIERIRQYCQRGHQVYWVCTLIEENEEMPLSAAERVYEHLRQTLSDLKIGLVHGRKTAKEKEAVMAAFKRQEINVLVATTVVEVGVDVPNASLMIIENPERLGLSQLHQLRGRVGRGNKASYCVLLYQSPLSKVAKQRLMVMRDIRDGFILAEHDLRMRGPGEVLGVRQTGLVHMKMADLLRDATMLEAVKEAAEALAASSTDSVSALIQRWLPEAQSYAQV